MYRELVVRSSEVKILSFKRTTFEIVCHSAAKDVSRLESEHVLAKC